MSRIDEMIRELCPEGVQFKSLGDYIELYTGVQFNKSDMNLEGSYPVINGGIQPSGYIEQSNEPANTITISQGGASAGYVNFLSVPFWAGAHCFVIRPKDSSILLNRFLYHFVKEKELYLQQAQQGAGIPSVNRDKIKSIQLPLLSISIQQEIVSVLDSFTTLIDKMKSEVEKRKKLMEYYREKLLNFEENECEWKILKEIATVRNGYTPSKNSEELWANGSIPWFRLEDIRQNGRILSDAIQHITPKAVKKGGPFIANSLIISTTATIGEHALVKVPFVCNQQITVISLNTKEVDPCYLYHYGYKIGDWCRENTNGAGLLIIPSQKVGDCMIPIPPLEEQQDIVSKLDKFEIYISKLETLIALRQKQFEYYREKLLTF